MNNFLDLAIEVLTDAGLDCLKLMPFLFVTYLCMELLEAKGGARLQQIVSRAEKSGPIWGAVLGVVPQCGFSAAASSFYAGHVISAGTLIAVFMSTSDEMLPIFISSAIPVLKVVKILVVKVILAIITGYAAGAIFDRVYPHKTEHIDIHSVCEHEHCDCHSGVLKSAIVHTLKISLYIFIFSVLLNILMETVGEEYLRGIFLQLPFIGVIIAAVIGLIPNCASSVLLTQLYLDNIISLGAMMGGLLVGAGVGLLILFRLEANKKKCMILTTILLFSGIFWGIIIDILRLKLL